MAVKTRVKMPAQDPLLRIRNFSEVALGYTEEMAIEEASRCLQCKDPVCQKGCPVAVQIKDFIGLIRKGDFDGAIDKIKETNSLPAVCGRVCPQEEQCEQSCILNKAGRPIAIGRLERYVADRALARGLTVPPRPASNGKKVAVVGSGPAGLAAAGDLVRRGYQVTVYEALHDLGGVLIYGIPEFRLPKKIVRDEVEILRAQGVDFQTDVVVGKTITVDEIKELGYQAVFLGTGAGLPKFMDIPGESLNGVFSANEFLTRINLMKAYLFPEYDTPVKIGARVAVVGAGNVAMDAARSARRLPNVEEVYIVYRRSEAEMPARKEELEHAKEEGIVLKTLTNPVRILGNDAGWVTGLECHRMELGEPDASGRRRPVAVKGSQFVIEVDTVIMALGTSPNPLVSKTTPGLQTQDWGGLAVEEETGLTSREGVYAGGDAVTGAATVILAMGAGKKAAAAIHEYLLGK
ncbi:MAG: NADPH-dependent glutamate synthase [Firmicutes bacterium]|nr:NADPH-dependent glutamate synthase [Bacillota bacterium]